jgi:hypothetical protein
MKKTVDKIPFYRLGWNKYIFLVLSSIANDSQLFFLNGHM